MGFRSSSGLRHRGSVCEPGDGTTYEEIENSSVIPGAIFRRCRICGVCRFDGPKSPQPTALSEHLEDKMSSHFLAIDHDVDCDTVSGIYDSLTDAKADIDLRTRVAEGASIEEWDQGKHLHTWTPHWGDRLEWRQETYP